ncbi:fimbrial protein [Citrobacter freundii]|uniref:fimbrial protein n=1 Tax=Citrobacter portucalensis TaxID=1639133 RepID=UPI0015E9B3EA|nr:fimbrial protein [Citrobacter freundii]QMD59246.1 fimbrial protein [Citrobacter freundii]
MKKNLLSLPVATLIAIATSGTVLAAETTNLDVNFTANIRETTCDMKLVGGTGSDTAQTLIIGDSDGQVRFENIRAGTATANFKIVLVECPDSLQSLKTSVNGSVSSLNTALTNSIAKASGGAENAGVAIARTSEPDSPFVINSTVDGERLVWTPTEISNKEVPLIAIMKETKASSLTTGKFEALATFQFNYE